MEEARIHQTLLIAMAVLLGLYTPGRTWAQNRPPLPKVEVLQPSVEQLVGPVEVLMKVSGEGKVPGQFHVGLGGPPWAGMAKAGGSNEWTATIDTTLVPNGSYQLMVVSNNKRVGATKSVTIANPLKVYFADLHSHTSYSDGTLLPAVAHEYARNVAKLDVFSLTDHLESVDDPEWLDTREAAWDANVDGVFVAIPGLEWTKKWGHMNIYDPKTRVWPEDPKAFYEAIAAADVVAKFNHPGDGIESHGGLAYSELGDKAVQMLELRRPKEEKAFIRALNAGWHVAPDGSSDTHQANWGNVQTWTGIIAPGLSKRCIWDAMKSRRVYSTHDRNCRLMFTMNGAVMGSVLDKPVKKVEVAVTIKDTDAGDAAAKIELFEDGLVVETVEPGQAKYEWKTTRTPEPGPHYYFVKVIQADGNLLWSAPVWVKVAAE